MIDESPRGIALEKVERATDLPLLVLSVVMIPVLVAPLLFDLSDRINQTLLVIDWLIWAVFAIDLLAKTYLAPRRVHYLTTHWFDVIIVVVPFLRPLRILRSARALRLLRLTRFSAFFARSVTEARDLASRHGLQYALLLGLIAVVGSAALVRAFERNSDGSINDFGTALWWAATTVTTVGYGDTYPKTAEGRGVAVFLMLVGITLFSVLTANIAAFFVETKTSGEPTMFEIMQKLEDLEAQIAEVQQATRATSEK